MNLKKPNPTANRLIEIAIIFLLIVATVAINLKMIRDGINGMVDLKWHIPWLQHFSKELSEGIWYPRWLAGTNYGYGSPTFVFYPPLVYYLGSLLKIIGLEIQDTIIVLFSLAIFFSGFNFYLFSRYRWGIIPSFIGALAYMSAPYMAFDVYYRGAISSIFVQAWIPLLWWCSDRALENTKWRLGVAFGWTLIALTHTPSLILCMIIWLPYILVLLLYRNWKNVVGVIIFALAGLGVASLYLFPVLLEKSIVNLSIMKDKHGGFAASLIGLIHSKNVSTYLFPLETENLAHIPYIFLHQVLIVIVLVFIAWIWLRRQPQIFRATHRWQILAAALVFMMSYLSLPLWSMSETLQMVQFPWRLLQIFTFVGAALCTVVVRGIFNLKTKYSKALLVLVISGILLVNYRHSAKLSRQYIAIRNPGRGSIEHLGAVLTAINNPYADNLRDVPEYRPLLKDKSSPPEPVPEQPKFSIVEGEAEIKLLQWKAYQRKFNLVATEPSTITIRTYYYPAWHLYINDNREIPLNISERGTIEFTVEPGNYQATLQYQPTYAFKVGISLSLFSLLVLLIYWYNPKLFPAI